MILNISSQTPQICPVAQMPQGECTCKLIMLIVHSYRDVNITENFLEFQVPRCKRNACMKYCNWAEENVVTLRHEPEILLRAGYGNTYHVWPSSWKISALEPSFMVAILSFTFLLFEVLVSGRNVIASYVYWRRKWKNLSDDYIAQKNQVYRSWEEVTGQKVS